MKLGRSGGDRSGSLKTKQFAVSNQPNWNSENSHKRSSTSFRQSFRIEVEPLFSTKRLPPGGVWLRDVSRGPQESGDRDVA
jgi:hypothetical protein